MLFQAVCRRRVSFSHAHSNTVHRSLVRESRASMRVLIRPWMLDFARNHASVADPKLLLAAHSTIALLS